jgi:hypothetical protein
MKFCGFLHQHITDKLFLHGNLWTDACFTRDDVFIVGNSHLWARDNPNATRGRSLQRQRLDWNCRRHVVDPYLLPHMLNAQIRVYRDFLEAVLPGLLGDVLLAVITARRGSSLPSVDEHMSRKVHGLLGHRISLR